MSTKTIVSFSLLLLLHIPNTHHVLSEPNDLLSLATPVTVLDRLPLPSNAFGPESLAFDPSGGGPYIGVTDGRILEWSGNSTGFVRFALTTANWSQQLCDSRDENNLQTSCGRPLGIEFYNKTATLYIADAYYNLQSIGLDGGVTTTLASSAEGVPFKFLDAMEVDQDSGVVYFSDASTRFQLNDLDLVFQTHDTSGRFMKYDPATKQVTVLLHNLGGPGGAALSKDGSFILVSEFVNCRILRYWLKGPKANTSEIFFISPGSPDNIKRNADGNFWVAVSIRTVQVATPLGVLLGQDGQVLRVLNFATANMSVSVSNVQEYNGKLYIGSLSLDYIGVTRNTTG